MIVENGDELTFFRCIQPRAEPEIAFRLRAPLEGNVPHLEAGAAIEGVAAAIEIPGSRFKNFKARMTDVIADISSSSRAHHRPMASAVHGMSRTWACRSRSMGVRSRSGPVRRSSGIRSGLLSPPHDRWHCAVNGWKREILCFRARLPRPSPCGLEWACACDLSSLAISAELPTFCGLIPAQAVDPASFPEWL